MELESELMRITELEQCNRQTAANLYNLARSFTRPDRDRFGLEIEEELSDIEARLERLMEGFRCRSL